MATALLYLAVAVGTLLALRAPFLDALPRPSLPASIVLALVPMALVGPAIVTGRIYAPLDLALVHEPLRSVAPEGFDEPHAEAALDVALQIVPWHAAVRAAWSAGEWPLLNSSMLAGDTLAASAQAAPYHPLNLLALLLPLGPACTFLAAATLFVAAIGMFLFLREIGCREVAALAGAAGYALSGFVVFWLLWPMGLAAAHLPGVLGVFELVRATRFDETLRDEERRAPLRPLVAALLAGVLAVGLSAIFLFPILDALPQSAQFEGRRAGFADADHSAPFGQAAARARTAAVPFVYGLPWRESAPTGDAWFVPASSAYVGAVLLAPALLGLWRGAWPGRFLLAAFAVFGIAAGATFPGVTEALALVPLVDLSIHKRWVMLGALGLAALAALGVDAFCRVRFLPRDALVAHGVALVGLVALLAVSWPRMAERLPGDFLVDQSAWLLVPIALSAGLFARLAGKWSIYALLALLLVQRVGEAGDRYPSLEASWVYPESPILRAIPEPRSVEAGRFVATGELLPPNLASVYGVQDVRGYQPLALGRYVDTLPFWTDRGDAWFYRVDDLESHSAWLDLLGVRWALTDGPTPTGWRERAREGDLRLLENPDALPRAFVPRALRVDAPATDRRRAMRHADDLGRVGWIERVPEGLPETRFNAAGTVRIEGAGTRRVLHADFDAPGWVIVTEPGWRGWRARIERDGKSEPLAVHRAQHAFLALELPAGESVVRMVYAPRSFLVGRTVTGATLLLLFGAFVVRLWRSRPR